MAPDAHAVLILDQAGWHLAGALVVPENITIRRCAAFAELNWFETLGSSCARLASNRFQGDDDIVAHCCAAWNDLIDQPWRIRSIGRRTVGAMGSDVRE